MLCNARLRRWLLGALLALAATQASGAPEAKMRLALFGDSLLDSGNVHRATRLLGLDPAFPPSAPPYRRYWEGRFSNGPNAADYLSARICGRLATPSLVVADRVAQTCGVNFAFGGATAGYWQQGPSGAPAPGLRAQVELFAAALGGAAPASALYVIWVGADDYLFGAPQPQAVVGHIAAGVRDLHRIGARRFVVLDLPDLGNLPLSAGTARAARLARAAETHNRELSAAARALRSTLPEIDLRLVAVSDLARSLDLRPDPGPAAGCLERFLRLASACRSLEDALFYSAAGLPAPSPGFFWDELHPTTRAHRRIFEAIEQALGPARR